VKRKYQLKQTNVIYAAPGSNKAFNAALRTKCLSNPVLRFPQCHRYITVRV